MLISSCYNIWGEGKKMIWETHSPWQCLVLGDKVRNSEHKELCLIMIFGDQEICCWLAPKKAFLGNRCQKTARRAAERSYLRVWGSDDPIESSPSGAKKWVIWRSIEKETDFWAKNAVFLAQNQFFGNVIQIFCHHHDGTPKRQGFCVEPIARGASGRPPEPIFGLKISIFLRYTHITPIFWGQTDPTQ